MSPPEVTNVGASVRQRLLNLARDRGEEFQFVLMRFALERFLYRLGSSPYADRLMLKGALLFVAWTGVPYRATRDADFLGFGANTPDATIELLRDILANPVDASDGITFLVETLTAVPIVEERDYQGVRVRLGADLDRARIPVTLDVGFGDALGVPPEEIAFPTLLDHPVPHIRAYPPEVVIAEKFEAMVKLGIANTRMKDLYDVVQMSRAMTFDGVRLSAAITATFDQRGTTLPQRPTALSPDFSADASKRAQWRAFQRRIGEDPTELSTVTEALDRFLVPIAEAARTDVGMAATWDRGRWMPGALSTYKELERRVSRQRLARMAIDLTPEDVDEMRSARTRKG